MGRVWQRASGGRRRRRVATGELAAEGRDGGWWPRGEWGAAVAEIDGRRLGAIAFLRQWRAVAAAWRGRVIAAAEPMAMRVGGGGGGGERRRWAMAMGLAAVAAWRGRVPAAAAMRVGGGGGERR
ncbi:hypothetical protein DAI22_08g165033 [Oryza sativa Japonica Group]|nr:hypothetical protein DAI22_08g165033 [Oryza sativa Japonica Group]